MDVTEYVCGGYFLTVYANRTEWMSAELLPQRIVSACDEIAPHLPDRWAMPWAKVTEKERRQSVLLELGVAWERLAEIGVWIDENWGSGELVFTDLFRSPTPAREFTSRFLPNSDRLVLLGIGLHRELVKEFLDRCKPKSGETAGAVYEAIRRSEQLEPGGEPLGFELLEYFYNLACSWLCNGLEKDAHEKDGIRPNGHGLIPTFQEASRFVARINSGEIKAEPGWWAPWLLVRYSL